MDGKGRATEGLALLKEKRLSNRGQPLFYYYTSIFIKDLLPFLQRRYYRILCQSLAYSELTNDLILIIADDKGGVHLRISILEVHRLREMAIGKGLGINDLTIIILNDQGELLSSGVIKHHLEDDIVVAGAQVIYSYLLICNRTLL